MDVSGSMDTELADSKIANLIYVDLLRAVDRAGVIQFDHTIVRRLPMTGDFARVRDTINAAVPLGGTAIYDALALAVQETKSEIGRRRAIILYTDGNDNASIATVQSVIDSAQAYGIPIYTIALGFLTSDASLERIAQETGGLFFKSPTEKEMAGIYRRLSDIVQNFYVMAHGSPDPVRNNTWRTVDVTADLPGRNGRGKGYYFVRSLPSQLANLVLTQSALTDSFAAVGNDTLRFARAGETYRYQLTISNESSITAQNVVVTNFFADSIRASNFQPNASLVTSDSVQWQLASLAPFSKTVLQFDATVSVNMPVGTNLLINKANAFAANEDPAQLANNVSVDTVYNFVKQAPPPPTNTDLAMAMAALTDTSVVLNGRLIRATKPGEEYEYRLKVRNRGPASASNIHVRQLLPDSVSFVRSSLAPLVANQDSIAWQLASLNVGEEDSIGVKVKLVANVPQTLELLISEAQLFATNDTAASNNVAVDTVRVAFPVQPPQLANLAIFQSALTDSFAAVGSDTLRFARASETYRYRIALSNESAVAAQNVVVTNFFPDSIRASNFQPNASLVTSDSVQWQLASLAPFSKMVLQFDATVSASMPLGTNLLINKATAFAANEDPAQLANNVSVDTVINIVKPLPPLLPPRIEARPATVNVGEKIFVRVQVLDEVSSWDLWVYFAGGGIDSSFADAFIAATPKPAPNVWYEVEPAFDNTRLFTTAEQEEIRFEIRTRDRLLRFAEASASVIVQSSNDMALDRNVFEPDHGDPLEISFKLGSNRKARLEVYDLAGHYVTKLAEGDYSAGWNVHVWNGVIAENGYVVGSGVYLVLLRAGEYEDWKKVIIIR